MGLESVVVENPLYTMQLHMGATSEKLIYTIDSCVICLENDPLPITNLFDCGCKAIIHNVCLKEWYRINRSYQCIICRKTTIIPLTVPIYTTDNINRYNVSNICKLLFTIVCSCYLGLSCAVLIALMLYVLLTRF
jgi:hypothetical protein